MPENEELHKIGLLVARLDERTKSMVETMNRMEKEFGAKYEEAEKTYVTRNEFMPVKILVYGFVGLTMIAVVGALLTVVIK